MYYGGSGSSWLVNTIERARPVLVPCFEPVERHHWKAKASVKLDWVRTALTPPPKRDDEEAMAEWEGRLRTSPQFERLSQRRFSYVGFKMSVDAVKAERRLLDLLVERDTYLIFLKRQNRVKHALSLYRSSEEGKNQFGSDGEHPASRVNLKAFDKWLKHAAERHQTTAEFHDRCRAQLPTERLTTVAYEDFVTPGGKAETIERMFSFLGIDQSDYRGESTFAKATPDALSVAVGNYDELAAKYQGTEFAAFFAE